MKILISLAAVAGVGLMASPAAAQGAWCAEAYGPSGYRNCGYYTLEQCRAGASGVGGHCYPSPWASRGTVIEPRKRTKRSKRDR